MMSPSLPMKVIARSIGPEGEGEMTEKSQPGSAFKVGDRVRLVPETLAWKAEMALQGQIGEVIERRDDGRTRHGIRPRLYRRHPTSLAENHPHTPTPLP